MIIRIKRLLCRTRNQWNLFNLLIFYYQRDYTDYMVDGAGREKNKNFFIPWLCLYLLGESAFLRFWKRTKKWSAVLWCCNFALSNDERWGSEVLKFWGTGNGESWKFNVESWEVNRERLMKNDERERVLRFWSSEVLRNGEWTTVNGLDD